MSIPTQSVTVQELPVPLDPLKIAENILNSAMASKDTFPINLDDVHKVLGYSTKGNAVASLKQRFLQGIQFPYILLIN